MHQNVVLPSRGTGTVWRNGLTENSEIQQKEMTSFGCTLGGIMLTSLPTQAGDRPSGKRLAEKDLRVLVEPVLVTISQQWTLAEKRVISFLVCGWKIFAIRVKGCDPSPLLSPGKTHLEYWVFLGSSAQNR